MTVRIRNSVCFVTGSNRGIGKAIVEELLAQGAAKVYAGARKVESLKALIATSNGRIVAVGLDVTNKSHVAACAQLATDTQILINNAGVAEYSAVLAAPDDTAARREMEVNYFGLMSMTRAFAPILKKNNGCLVNIGSCLSYISAPSFGTYSATKAAVHSLTQAVRGELKASGTLVIGVYPGPIETDMTAGVDMEKDTPQNVAKDILKAIENGTEDVYPDKMSKVFIQDYWRNAKELERQWAQNLPQESLSSSPK